ncbi:pyridoxamine 5'-phosphate oxidase family protein [Streptomyces sp. H10-C2]|uniref:pyridoxamine 5'-phosphate oxidase family protein n=1 Tax=unclassified Streptomyces TaxID=2593676 RepID=UPI0024B9F26F|nr:MULTISPECIES: pyridoxamine 5'-phosphate oxidase family protein [unclassified Streptomyces]MDJ0345797.1 pyridoxamine 5'-phosphate oxidase family protein [Streptomyces sp. PH10-H1]MDJ0374687.1 pyridoxamine 5'-phosphate oxidase family protein [Streptomyces sp. H10-C2]
MTTPATPPAPAPAQAAPSAPAPASPTPASPAPAGPRSLRQRKDEALHRLEHDGDVWVATADAQGTPCLVPLFFLWDGEALWLSTRGTNPTGRNLRATGLLRACLGHTRDVVQIDGTARTLTAQELPTAIGDAFAAKGGWDPREDGPSYLWFRIQPHTIQAWGTVAELKERDLMREGQWIL